MTIGPGSIGSPITPVEAWKTSPGAAPIACAVSLATAAVVVTPAEPVKALALPELTTSARARPAASAARHQSTGAEGHFDRVKTPATCAGRSNNASITSVRPW